MTFSKRNPSFINKPATTFQAGDTAGLAMWVAQRQAESNNQDLVWGRIKDTGINFVVEGYQRQGDNRQWVQIPCRRLLDAHLHLGQVMDSDLFEFVAPLERYKF